MNNLEMDLDKALDNTALNYDVNIIQYSIAISLKRIADHLDKPIQLTESDQPPTPHNTFTMMYENHQPKEHSSRNDTK